MSLTESPIYSEKKIKTLTQYLQDRIAEHMRLQRAGKLPYCKRIPVTVIEIRHIMEIMNRSRSTAHRLMSKIRKKLGKKDDEYVSVSEFCEATGLPEREVTMALNLLT
jgi:hypothetical protein